MLQDNTVSFKIIDFARFHTVSVIYRIHFVFAKAKDEICYNCIIF
jgi:hypothetical protein